MAANYDQVVSELRAAGLILRDGLEVGTGRTVRCAVEGDREKRGWYRLTEVLIGDQHYLVGAYGIWRGNDNGKIAIRPGRGVELSREQRQAITDRIRSDTAKAQAVRQAEAARAARAAASAWRRYLPEGTCDYLTRKGVGAHGVRFHPTAQTMAIPMQDTQGQVWGLELIRGSDRGDRLEKQYWPRGLDKVGHYHLIGGSPRALLLLAEGYATAASLYEATGWPVAVAFDAGNLLPVARVLRKQYPRVKILVCADDDYRTDGNPGQAAASAAALAVEGRWLCPVFAAARPETGKKGPTDWNDLHALEGLPIVRSQIETHLTGVGWLSTVAPPHVSSHGGGGAMVPRLTVDEAVQRYWGTYGLGGKVFFDAVERRLVHKDDVMNLLPRHGLEGMRAHPDWRVARDSEIGFDPSQSDPGIKCNLFGGWPTTPKAGCCDRLLELLEWMCQEEPDWEGTYNWCLDWLAYPIQRPGAKMHTALVFHGWQGGGKNRFFEAYGAIYGEYFRVLGQEALEDKFNADWAEKKLFILADEVLARQDMFHIKNRLKGFITGGTIRVNPKNVAAHNEANHMNIVFLSNERMPLVLEKDDRRHCVVWTRTPPPAAFFDELTAEIDNGGVAALHHYLLQRDLGDFNEATKPPLTKAKLELIDQGASNEERFVREWKAGWVDNGEGATLPFCPCLGSHLYSAYRRWCERHGERTRRAQDLIGHCGKLPGWRAGNSERTWVNLNDRSPKNRKLVVPSPIAIEESIQGGQIEGAERFRPDVYSSQQHWYTVSLYAFANALGEEVAG